MVFPGTGAAFFENFEALHIEPLAIKNMGKVDLFPDLNGNTFLLVDEPEAFEYLPVQMLFHVGQLVFLKAIYFFQNLLVIGFLLFVENIKKLNEFQVRTALCSGSIKLKITFFSLRKRFYQVEKRIRIMRGYRISYHDNLFIFKGL